MEKNKEAKQRILSEALIVFDKMVYKAGLTGQSTNGPPPPGVKIWHPIGVSVYINVHRNEVKNRELAMTLFELALDDVLK